VLDFGGAGEDLEEWERAPSFWFPNEAGDFDIFALTGLDEDWSMEAVIWGQPLSRFAGDVTSAQKLV
jgi:hypothetical protein